MAPSSACVPSVRGLRGGVYASSCACCACCVRLYRRGHGASFERRICVRTTTAPAYTPAPQGWRGFYLGAHLGGTWGSSEAKRRHRRHPQRFMELFAQRPRRRRHARLQLAARADDLRRRGRSRQSRACRQRRLLRAVRLRRLDQHGCRFLYDAARPARRAGERLDAVFHRRLSWRRHDGLGSRSLR